MKGGSNNSNSGGSVRRTVVPPRSSTSSARSSSIVPPTSFVSPDRGNNHGPSSSNIYRDVVDRDHGPAIVTPSPVARAARMPSAGIEQLVQPRLASSVDKMKNPEKKEETSNVSHSKSHIKGNDNDNGIRIRDSKPKATRATSAATVTSTASVIQQENERFLEEAKKKAPPPAVHDEKAKFRQASLDALEQQRQQQNYRPPVPKWAQLRESSLKKRGSGSGSILVGVLESSTINESTHALAPPQRHRRHSTNHQEGEEEEEEEDPDVLAKRQGRHPSNHKVHRRNNPGSNHSVSSSGSFIPPPMTVALARRTTTMSSVSTTSTGSTTVTQNTATPRPTTTTLPAATTKRGSFVGTYNNNDADDDDVSPNAATTAQLQAVALVLEEDDSENQDIVDDGDDKKKGSGPIYYVVDTDDRVMVEHQVAADVEAKRRSSAPQRRRSSSSATATAAVARTSARLSRSFATNNGVPHRRNSFDTAGSKRRASGLASHSQQQRARRNSGTLGASSTDKWDITSIATGGSHGSFNSNITAGQNKIPRVIRCLEDDDMNASQHSMLTVGSAIGAHSVRGVPRRASKKAARNTSNSSESGAKGIKDQGDDDEEEEEDAVVQYLSEVAHAQQAAVASSMDSSASYGNNTDDEDSFAVDSFHRKSIQRSSSKGSNHHLKQVQLVDCTILEDKVFTEDDYDDDGDEFENVKSGATLDDDAARNNDRGVVEEEEADLEAQLGARVGAFAVEGINSNGVDDWNEPFDSDLNRGLMENPELSRNSSGSTLNDSRHVRLSGNVNDPTLTDPSSALFQDNMALEAELHEPPHEDAVLVDALVLPEEPETLSAKTLRRWRMMQCTVLCLALGAIAAVVAVTMSRSSAPTAVGHWQSTIPVIDGWKQVGQNLTGPIDKDNSLYGYSIAMAANGERIAIGSPSRDKSTTELLVGEVHIMDWNGTQWLPNGLPLPGPGPDAQAGTAVAISKNGKRVAVGSPYFYGGGHVAVYEELETENAWVLVGQVLMGNSSEDGDERFGSALALSDDGSTLAVGAPMGEAGHNGTTDSGYVKIFRLQSVESGVAINQTSSEWGQLGDTIAGENAGDFFGWSLTLSFSGARIAVGAVGSFGGDVGEFTGQVRIFDYQEDLATWIQAGKSISGRAAFDSFGSSLAMSDDGEIIAVGAIGHSNAEEGIDIGRVQVFQFEGGSTSTDEIWQALGQELVGENAFDSFGYSVSLSSDGKTLGAGGPRNDDFAESSGHIQVFKLDETASSWARRGSDIGGSYDGRDLFGWSVALSSDGSRVAGSAPFHTFDGRVNDVGVVRIYDASEEENGE